MTRAPLDHLDGTQWDVVVIGAGAVGCAAARELAGRGYSTLLLDRGDFGSGTSSRSSRMLYSGLGYLAVRYPLWQMALHPLDMVQRLLYTRDVMRCRAVLVRDMPGHLTRHRFFYPFRKGDRYPPWLVDLGFRLVEALGGWKVPLSYRRITPGEAAAQSALAAGLGGPLRGVGVFDEYMYAWPERICVDTALDAERRGATLRTYTEVTHIARHEDGWAVSLGERAPLAEGQARVMGRMVVNAAGPWVDRLSGAGGDGKGRIVGVKGVNVMVRLPDAYRGEGLEAFSSKGEPFYVFPWRDSHFIGPTETVVSENPDDIRVEDAEIDYILSEANRLFPDLGLTRDHVLHCWCGVRPTSTLDGRTSRTVVRAIENPEAPGLVTMTGSTIMLHRHAGCMAARAVERRLGRRGPAPSGVIEQPPAARSEAIGQLAAAEHVVRLSDLLRRRLPDGLDADLGRDRAEGISRVAAAGLGWSEERRQQELDHFERETAMTYPRPVEACGG
ncbi:glycerol-3-phosphate dehydrogenase [Hoeflea marina]|uniref:Glycerol-3-phosphate dehydrogenase n=1 Tax=Hoeflea marina TaxID=274592 RepID=A0A317PKL6_9HYPH|nr:FAD-dependent oxidoreductase [Hoeflea marina]PWW01492.1 glycerol-3-phosphate dehydrogenase [Hoeflea marina]